MLRPAWSLIPALLACGSPTAGGGPIVAIHVDAVDGVSSARPPSHVGEELLIGTTPASADADPAATVQRPILRVLILAALDRVRPTVVFGGVPAATPLAMLPAARVDPFEPIASARVRVPRAQVAAGALRPASTIAAEVPDGVGSPGVADRRCTRRHDQAAETLAAQVNRLPATLDAPTVFEPAGKRGAPARARLSAAKVAPHANNALPALAATVPSSVEAVAPSGGCGLFRNCEPAECLAGEIDRSRRGISVHLASIIAQSREVARAKG